MLNEKKIRLMTKLALCEEQEREEIEFDKYYRIDYIRYQVLKSLIAATIGYALVLLAVVGYQFQKIVDHVISINYRTTAYYVIAIYILVLVFYGTVTGVVSYFQYENSKKSIRKYKKNLKALRLLYKEESNMK